MSSFDVKMLEILACPLSKTLLIYEESTQRLISPEAGVSYPIQEGIPILLIEEAQIIDEGKAAPYLARLSTPFSPRTSLSSL